MFRNSVKTLKIREKEQITRRKQGLHEKHGRETRFSLTAKTIVVQKVNDRER